MNKIFFAISLVSSGLLLFAVCCHVSLALPTAVYILFLMLLQVGLVWMVLTILKNGKPSPHTFDERFYEDYNHVNGKFE